VTGPTASPGAGEAPEPPAPAPAAQGSREPGIGAIAALAFAVVLVPGILLYAVLRAVGLEIGPAGLLGLALMFGCVVIYPVLLRRLGWVGRR